MQVGVAGRQGLTGGVTWPLENSGDAIAHEGFGQASVAFLDDLPLCRSELERTPSKSETERTTSKSETERTASKHTTLSKTVGFKECRSESSESSRTSMGERLFTSDLIDNEISRALANQGGDPRRRPWSFQRGMNSKDPVTNELDRIFWSLQDADERPSGSLTRACVPEIEVQEFVGELHVMIGDLFEHHKIRLDKKHKYLPAVLECIFEFEPQESEAVKVMTKYASKLEDCLHGAVGRTLQILRLGCRRIISHAVFVTILLILTFYVLFVPDMVVAFGSKDSDFGWEVFNSIIWFLFLLELIMYFLAGNGYMYSLSFVLDLVALLSFLSETWLYQGDLFGSNKGTQITRYARSARMTRVVRLARVARVTRLAPQIMESLGIERGLARVTLARRLRRLFRYLDTDNDDLLTSLDFRCFYFAVLRSGFSIVLLGTPKAPQAKADLLKADIAVIRESEGHRLMDFNDFSNVFLSTNLGKSLLRRQAEEAKSSDGGWSLTQHFTGRISLKVCVGVLITIIMFSLFQPSVTDQSIDTGLALLATTAGEADTSITLLCDMIRDYTDSNSVLLLFLNDRTYVNHGSGQICADGGVARSALNPFARMQEIMDATGKRDSEIYMTCFPGASVADTGETECIEELATSGALVDQESLVRENAVYDIYMTLLVVGCLSTWLCSFNVTVTKFTRTLLQPLSGLVDDMKALTSLHLAYIDADTLSEETVADVANLEGAFKQMRTSVRSWTKYVPPSVVQCLFTAGVEARIGVSRCLCSVLFCDIAGFEGACSDMTPSDILSLLETVFSTIGNIVDREGGTLLEFIGDEVLAVFNAPLSLKNHTLRSARSALDITKEVEGLDLSLDGKPVMCRCGVHSAKVLAGNVGSIRRMKYGLLGDGVNLTARLKSLNSRYNTQALASDTVAADDFTARRLVFRPVDKVAVKGRTEPTVVYEILATTKVSSDVKKIAVMHAEAFKFYYDRQFAQAKQIFMEVRNAMRGLGRIDEPSKLFIQRCTMYLKDPPPDNWDGVEKLTAKIFVVEAESEDAESEEVTSSTLRD